MDAADAQNGHGSAPSVAGAVLVSALTGFGLETLRDEIAAVLASLWQDVDIAVPYTAGELLARVRERGTVELEYRDRDVRVRGRMAPSLAGELEAVSRRWAATLAEEAGSSIVITLLRRAGSGRLTDGSRLVWTVAEGSRGRRWRWTHTSDVGLSSVGLLELDEQGGFSRLELGSAVGLLTLHVGHGRRRGQRQRRGPVGDAAPPVPVVARCSGPGGRRAAGRRGHVPSPGGPARGETEPARRAARGAVIRRARHDRPVHARVGHPLADRALRRLAGSGSRSTGRGCPPGSGTSRTWPLEVG